MKKITLLLVAVIALSLTSCGVSKTVSSARTLNPLTDQMVADLEVAPMKVIGEFKCEFKKNTFVNEEELKQNAVYNALQTMKADVLVAPQFQIVKEIRGRKIYSVTVTGYPAFYRNFRPAPAPERVVGVEFKEINGIIFMITKNNYNEAVGYQIIVPTNKEIKTIEAEQLGLDQVVLDQIILKAKTQTGAPVVTTTPTQEKEGVLKSVTKSTKKTSKKSKK